MINNRPVIYNVNFLLSTWCMGMQAVIAVHMYIYKISCVLSVGNLNS